MRPLLRIIKLTTLTGIAWVVFIAGSLEMYSRFAFEPAGVHLLSELVYEPEIGWIGRANVQTSSKHGSFPIAIPVSINKDGFRDGDWDDKLRRARASHTKRVLLIGDSVLYGWGSDGSERLTESLARYYRLENIPVEIFNAGIPAYGTSQERRLLPRLLDRINPDIVVLLFSANDYGDTALPYDHRYPSNRVYKPFYDTSGALVLNDPVPQRPSLYFQNAFLGKLRLWYAIDVFYYALQNQVYKRRGVPEPNDFPIPIHRLDDLVYQDRDDPIFQRVERTVMALYRDMNTIARQHGARFLVVSALPLADSIVEPRIQEVGIDFVSFPTQYRSLLPWTYIYNDTHPNFLWAWVLAGAIFRHLEGKPSQPGFMQMPTYGAIPSELRLNNDRVSAKYITGTWGPPEEHARWALEGGDSVTGTTPHFILRVPDSSRRQVRVKISAWMQYEQELALSDHNGRQICSWKMVPDVYDYECTVEADQTGLLLGELTVPRRSVPDIDVPRQQSYRRLAAVFSVSVN